MRVLHVIPSVSERSGGPGQAIIPMCRALVEEGLDVLLATTNAGLSDAPDLECVTSYKALPVIFFPKQLGASFKYSRPFAQWLAKKVPDFDVVHIHAVFNHCSIAAARACHKQAVPYIIRPLGTLGPWGLSQKSFRKRVSLHTGIMKMLRAAAAIHYTTEGEQRAVEESLKLNHGVVIPLGVETPGALEFAKWHPTRNEDPYVLFLSRLLPTKGLEVLLDAFLSLVEHDAFRPWRLVLAGDGPPAFVAKLRQIVRERLAADFVVFTGWLDGERKNAALRNASLLALPSHHENFGLCVMESLACGVPVLASLNVNLAPEIAAAEAGWIVKVDKASLEQTLAAALSSETELHRRGRNGKVLAENYAWPRIAGQLSDLYGRIALSVRSAHACY